MQHGLPAPNDVIADKYTVLQPLGRGGMGAVYIVAHRLTGKRLALKCLLPEYLDNADLVERFLREAQAMGRIEHRHVVDVFDVGRDRDLLFIVMELLDGKPLSALLHDEQLTLEETLAILVRAMEGVAAAHVHGIVHRDLKPDNIFICWGASGRLDDPRVLDFGISKLDDGMAASLTRSGVAMGTPCYMSLEQLSGQRDLDGRVDVYAMGVILYEAIAGVPPHTADSVAALAIRVLTTAPTHLAELRPDLPAGLADVVMKAIARDRADRYPNMNTLMDAVRPYVPRGAGLLVPEGQGQPLRTPRSAGAVSTPAAARASAFARTPGPVAAPVFARAPEGALRRAPRAAPTSAGDSPVKWAALGAAGLLLLGGAGWAVLTLRPNVNAPASPAPAPPAATMEAPPAPGEAAQAVLVAPVDAGVVEAATALAPSDAPAPMAQDLTPPVRPEPGPRKKRERRGARTQNEPQPTPAPPSAKTAQGRAGKLGSDDF